jgi:K+/H+ antiporter YhaU regulatory subunit KhtT
LTEEVVEPEPDAKLQKGDILVVLGNPERLSHFRKAVDDASSREKTKSAEEHPEESQLE